MGYRVIGGRRLCGEVVIGGCKNAVLPILAATVLTGGKSVIHNCPDILDTHTSIEILRHLGCKVEYDGTSIIVDSAAAAARALPAGPVGKMRSSIIFAGALLSRFGSFETAEPGGCRLGLRPIDLHLQAFRRMGVNFDGDSQTICGKAAELTGAKINLAFPSVGATQNVILAATLARGRTIISNAAREPEIVDLQGFLQAAGAEIAGAGTSTIVIDGVEKLQNVEYKIMPDRIVAGTYLAAGAIAGGHIRLKNVKAADIMPIIDSLEDMGINLHTEGASVVLRAKNRPNPLPILATGPHPAFPTDMQPQFTALLAIAAGHSIVIENLFEARDAHISELVRMGADIKSEGHRFYINGVERLNGAKVAAKDLRGGAALILAGLAAKGETEIHGAEYIKRGYTAIDKDLKALNAEISVLKTTP
ncbi:MAG: UDP-N-acetylglucosamine 1-carboxyvinyltransferase [Clostridiales bacterium]|jgi:UDP-N-acetylglucosamine 1-carboxyvinyltransferase|nr:UDP-N-acetylglucosamine 1-carboxyvinyltransferase [Clostridiales bacterium]